MFYSLLTFSVPQTGRTDLAAIISALIHISVCLKWMINFASFCHTDSPTEHRFLFLTTTVLDHGTTAKFLYPPLPIH